MMAPFQHQRRLLCFNVSPAGSINNSNRQQSRPSCCFDNQPFSFLFFFSPSFFSPNFFLFFFRLFVLMLIDCCYPSNCGWRSGAQPAARLAQWNSLTTGSSSPCRVPVVDVLESRPSRLGVHRFDLMAHTATTTANQSINQSIETESIWKLPKPTGDGKSLAGRRRRAGPIIVLQLLSSSSRCCYLSVCWHRLEASGNTMSSPPPPPPPPPSSPTSDQYHSFTLTFAVRKTATMQSVAHRQHQ